VKHNLQITATAFAALVLCSNARAQSPTLDLHPGLTVNFSVYGGYSSNGQLLGDYDCVNRVTSNTDGGYSYDYWFTGPSPNSGHQDVSAADKLDGTTIREFYGNGNVSAKGYVALLALSDHSFAALKAGKETPFVFDGPDNPRSIKKIGEEDLTTLVNEKPTVIHTIKVRGGAGGTFWIIDNPALPMVVKGDFKWKWMATAISDAGTSGAQIVSALEQNGKATTHAILFAFNSAQLDREAKPVLDSVAQYLKSNPAVRLEIQGHTDDIGGAPFNLALSQQRAEAVKAYFVAAGLDERRFTPNGYGLSEPVADNATAEGRALNRRVVFRTL
jgi:outer membrane protein OmpA-like peptidoglycan-associated protein